MIMYAISIYCNSLFLHVIYVYLYSGDGSVFRKLGTVVYVFISVYIVSYYKENLCLGISIYLIIYSCPECYQVERQFP